jgi:hypothetical protein
MVIGGDYTLNGVWVAYATIQYLYLQKFREPIMSKIK